MKAYSILICVTPSPGRAAVPGQWQHQCSPQSPKQGRSAILSDQMDPRRSLGEQLVTKDIGEEIYALAAKIYPICRSITGDGLRETLNGVISQLSTFPFRQTT